VLLQKLILEKQGPMGKPLKQVLRIKVCLGIRVLWIRGGLSKRAHAQQVGKALGEKGGMFRGRMLMGRMAHQSRRVLLLRPELGNLKQIVKTVRIQHNEALMLL